MPHRDYYAVMGNPIHHSKSPEVHKLFAAETQQEIDYVPLLVKPGELATALDDFQSRNGKGVNITAPYKQEAFALVNDLTERALKATAINTIRFNSDGSRTGDNTDGHGLVRDLTINQNISIEGKTLLILGSGGAVWSVIDALLEELPAQIIIANRDHSRAEKLAAARHSQVKACEFSALKQYQFDMVINATSVNSVGGWSDLSLSKEAICYDMNYSLNTPFLAKAKSMGASVCRNGLGMLIEQAAESFYFWRGIRPNTQSVLSSMAPVLHI